MTLDKECHGASLSFLSSKMPVMDFYPQPHHSNKGLHLASHLKQLKSEVKYVEISRILEIKDRYS